MAKYKQVPKTLVFSDSSFDDIELISPESLFENFESDDSNAVYLSSPEELFSKFTDVKEVKLKSPEELWGKSIKKDKNNTPNKSSSNKNGKKSIK